MKDHCIPYIGATNVSIKDASNNDVILRGLPVSSGGNVTIDGQQYIADTLTDNGDGTGTVVRRVCQFALNGTELTTLVSGSGYQTAAYRYWVGNGLSVPCFCSHYIYEHKPYRVTNNYGKFGFEGTFVNLLFTAYDNYPTVDDWKAYLAAQYAAGTPVTVLYAIKTPTTETVYITPYGAKTVSPTTTIVSGAYGQFAIAPDYTAGMSALAARILALESAIT